MAVNKELSIADKFPSEIAPQGEGIVLWAMKGEETGGGIDRFLTLLLEKRKIRGFFVTRENPAIVDREGPMARHG